MKISGFTIIRNAVINDYPVVESITSILPVVDEMIVLVGDSKDETLTLIESIPSDKIKIHHSVWDPAIQSGGSILAIETNKALDLIDRNSDWAFYIQADEVVHEQYHDTIRQACREYANNENVEALVFKYLHFYATYDYVGDSRKWYHREIRLIKPHRGIESYRDAQGFRKQGKRLKSKLIDAYIYHYGWVKNPRQMLSKINHFRQYWGHSMSASDENVPEIFDFSQFDSLTRFPGKHPSVMINRIQAQNWDIDLDLTRKKFSLKDRLLYWFEKKTGIRLFAFKNYKLI